MKNPYLWAAAGLALCWQGPVLAESIEQRLARMEAAMQALQEKVESQEKLIRQHQTTIAEQKAHLEGTPKRLKKLADNIEKKRTAKSDDDAWFRKVEVGGVVEIEASHNSPYEGDSNSDIVLATFELGISSQIGDWVETGGSLLYEEDDTPLEVDIAYATIYNAEASPIFFTGGQIYVPFGAYESNMVSDPLTLEIGETRESTAQVGFVQGGFNGSVYLFNGTNQKNGKNRIDSWGANLGFAQESEEFAWAAGIGYISDLGDSDNLQGVIGGNLGSNEIGKRVSAITLNAAARFGAINVIGEYLSANQFFEVGAVPWQTGGAKPMAWNLEAGYSFDLLGKAATVALGYQRTKQALALKLPKQRWIATLSLEVYDATALSFEWAHDKDYGTGDGGTGKKADTLTAQLALEF